MPYARLPLSCHLLLCAAFSIAVKVGIASGQTVPETQPIPQAFVSAWQDAQSSSEVASARGQAALVAHPEWELHFRFALAGTTDQKLRDRLRATLNKARAGLIAWNLERARQWSKERRFDLLTALAADLDDTKQAGTVGDLLTAASHDVFDVFRQRGLFYGALPATWSFLLVAGHRRTDYFQSGPRPRIGGDSIILPADHPEGPAPTFVHAKRAEIRPFSAHSWLMLTDSDIILPEQQRPIGWSYSVACVNGGMRMSDCSRSLIICDGDLEVSGLDFKGGGAAGSASTSVWICNGNVEVDEDYTLDQTMIYAAGNYKGSDRITLGVIHTGGKNAVVASKTRSEKYFKENVKENPFGVKFVSPADVGVEIAMDKAGVRLAKVEEKSPFAAALIVKGDRIVAMNGVKVATAADFRRQLRDGLVWGTAVVEAERGGTAFTRLVKFAEPPKK